MHDIELLAFSLPVCDLCFFHSCLILVQTPHSFTPLEFLWCTWYWTPGLFSLVIFLIFIIHTFRSHTVLNLVWFLYVLDIELLAFFFRWWSLIFSFILYLTIRHYTVLNIIKTVGKYSGIRNVSMGDLYTARMIIKVITFILFLQCGLLCLCNNPPSWNKYLFNFNLRSELSIL